MNRLVQGLLSVAALLILGVEVGRAQMLPPPPPTQVSISIEEIKYVAPADGVVQVKVWLSAAATDTVTVQFATADGAPPSGATSPADYLSTSGTLVFSPGQTEKYITVTIVKTAPLSDDAYFSITLSSPSSNATVGIIPCFVYISPPPTVQFTSSAFSVVEGTAKTGYTKAPISVKLSKAAATDVTVKYNFAGGTATANVDYKVPSVRKVTIPAGQTATTFVVDVVPDSKVEKDETVKLVLATPSGAKLGAQSSATLTILDDDVPPPIVIGKRIRAEGKIDDLDKLADNGSPYTKIIKDVIAIRNNDVTDVKYYGKIGAISELGKVFGADNKEITEGGEKIPKGTVRLVFVPLMFEWDLINKDGIPINPWIDESRFEKKPANAKDWVKLKDQSGLSGVDQAGSLTTMFKLKEKKDGKDVYRIIHADTVSIPTFMNDFIDSKGNKLADKTSIDFKVDFRYALRRFGQDKAYLNSTIENQSINMMLETDGNVTVGFSGNLFLGKSPGKVKYAPGSMSFPEK